MTGAPREPWAPPPAPHADVTPRLAATVALVRAASGGGLEVLLTQRPATMRFAADVHVFPGGAVDDADADAGLVGRMDLAPDVAAARLGGDLNPTTAAAVHVAAIRELAEEAGVLLVDPPVGADSMRVVQGAITRGQVFAEVLDDLDRLAGRPVRLSTRALRPLSRWVTPPLLPRRFDARFFVAVLPDGARPAFAADEVVDHRWVRPRDALNGIARGDVRLWLPTFVTIQQLDALGGTAGLERSPEPGSWRAPEVRDVAPGIATVTLFGAGGVPGRTGTAWLVGREAVVLVDPGDPAPEAAEAIYDAIAARGGRLEAIALSDTGPDRAAGAEGIALRTGVPILAPTGSAAALPYAVVEVDPGAPVPYADVEVRLPISGGGMPPGSAG
ncbi:MAG TPA: MBL fold metallo-hydrolase [Candidatus Limnocylindrales bacterium]|nr:MBL fold metallo-hydrolase [Candidatus Limnocylindrales bacterium]